MDTHELNDEQRDPRPGGYTAPQPAGDETHPDPDYLRFPSILADAIEEVGASGTRLSKTLNAHDLANAVRLAEARWRGVYWPDRDA
ncbi:MAG: hypothetical protein M3364_09725 [Actinomycetota bacterium]|nr:hypothetical protein [Actinomycetota bacterium]